MAAILRLIILAPVAVLVVLLAMANRAPVQLSFDPMGGDAWTFRMPLFAAVLGALMLGVVFGGVAAWLGQHKHRRAARDNARAAREAEAEVERLRALIPPTTDPVVIPSHLIR